MVLRSAVVLRCVVVVVLTILSTAVYSADSASIRGTVKYAGKPPDLANIRFIELACSRQHSEPVKREDIIVNSNSTLKNVIVYVKAGLPDGKTYAPPAEPAVLDQRGCMYVPHVFGMQVGQELKILNSDPTIHNVNGVSKVGNKFNHSMLSNKVPPIIKKFTKPEMPMRIKCDIHPWMLAFAGVFDHPYFAVSKDDGSFEIKNLPAGQYTLEAWQEKLGMQELKVTVKESETATLDFTYADPTARTNLQSKP